MEIFIFLAEGLTIESFSKIGEIEAIYVYKNSISIFGKCECNVIFSYRYLKLNNFLNDTPAFDENKGLCRRSNN